MSPSRGIPTSRAYWELKAEQMLNRVFTPEAPIEVEIVETNPADRSGSSHQPERGQGVVLEPSTPADAGPAGSKRQRTAHALAAVLQRRPELVPISVAAASLITALGTVLIAGFWSSQQQALRQERNLVLLERLRAMGPNASGTPEASAQAQDHQDGLPPPPPNEPWMEELAQLPAGSAPSADVLRVPFSAAVTKPAPPALGNGASGSAGGGGSADGLPQLVGVVQIPGRNGSAIFQIGGNSTNASIGESIGNSGWRLRSASGDSAVIERGSQVRRISISSGF